MLRPATADDLDAIRRWRNHPQVREVSLEQDEITPAMHAAWWDKVQHDDTRQVLVYERGGVPCGVVSFFDIAQESGRRSAMWGYYLDNAGLGERGELLPAWMQIQREAVRHADTVLDLDVLSGEVMDHNAAVRRMNRRNGFVEIGTREHVVGEGTVPVHLIRRERPGPAPADGGGPPATEGASRVAPGRGDAAGSRA